MRFHLLYVPALIAAAPVHAEDFLTLQQAQALIFPGAEFTPQDFVLNDDQIAQLIKETQAPIWRRQIKVWRALPGAGSSGSGHRSRRSDHVRRRTRQLRGRQGCRDPHLPAEVRRHPQSRLARAVCREALQQIRSDEPDPTISGSTLSTTHITEGVKRVLATYALFMAGKAS